MSEEFNKNTDENLTDSLNETPDEASNEIPDKSSDAEPNETTDELSEDLWEDNGHTFTKLSDKYEDIKSSAYTMLVVGTIGCLLVILVLADVISLPLNPETSWLFYTVMGGIFIIFIIAGIVSLMHAKQVKIDADAEDELIKEIMKWAVDNISREELDKNLDLTQREELLYFGRADKIKNTLMHQFEEADEALIGELTEQLYQNIYENDDKSDSDFQADDNREDDTETEAEADSDGNADVE